MHNGTPSSKLCVISERMQETNFTRVMETSTIIIIAIHSVMPQLSTDEAGWSGTAPVLTLFLSV